MNDYNEFVELLLKYQMITPIWKYELDLIEKELDDNNKYNYLILFAIYFGLICDGNTCMSLDEASLSKKWEAKIEASKVLFENEDNNDENYFDRVLSISKNNYKYLSNLNTLSVIGNIFEIADNYLYLKKYNKARIGIIKRIKKLFETNFNNDESFKLEDCYKDGFELSKKQKEAVLKGLKKNLIITGGPGTGKTTTILFILLCLLSNNQNLNVYLAAASGKASSRMKESIINGLEKIDQSIIDDEVIDLIKGTVNDDDKQEIEEFTIHRLLGVDFKTGGFNHTKKNQFPSNSIFVIDEASMIDVCLFNNLLNAIPDGARLFILGDKDQLPSVEVGAVFSDLVKSEYLEDNVIFLDESRRFESNTEIYKLAEIINKDLDLPNINFESLDSFEIKEVDKKNCPIYYYLSEGAADHEQKEKIKHIVEKWGKNYYKDLQEKATNIEWDDNILEKLKEIDNYVETSKILCAENDGARGVKTINESIKKNVIDKKAPKSLSNQYPGQIMMINRNNKALNLYNGDTGILVSFKDDNTIYLMVKKTMKRINKEEKKDDEIFKYGPYVFYPFRLITLSDIELAYAISIHKSQGSDFDNILIMLPTSKGHPLLNRQILYTAITRTKGNTYILSNKERLEEAKANLIERDTNINIV